jgi:trehalose synthase
MEPYDCLVFDLEDYVPSGLKGPVQVVNPGIDPRSPKNMELPHQAVSTILQQYGLDLSRPMICQTSPFDQWHDPVGLIEAYRAIKDEVPGVQLVLIASMVSEDPEARAYYQQATHYAERDPHVFVLSSLNNVGNIEMNAFQRASSVMVQRSLRKGFALWLSEALWKGRPVVAAKKGGIPRQVIEGRTGYLIEGTEECAQRILYLLTHPEVAERMGNEGKKHVGSNFLITQCLRNYLQLLAGLQK